MRVNNVLTIILPIMAVCVILAGGGWAAYRYYHKKSVKISAPIDDAIKDNEPPPKQEEELPKSVILSSHK